MIEKYESNYDELPVVSKNSPIKRQRKKSSFAMPDASVIAAQRKLEAELEELASNMLNDAKNSCDKMCIDLPIIKSDRSVEELYRLIFNEVNTGESNEVLSENPGIDSKHIDFDVLKFCPKKFVKMFLEIFHKCTKDSKLEDCLNDFTNDVYKRLTNDRFDLDSLNLFIILFSILLVDKKLRCIMTNINRFEILHLCLKKIPVESQTSEFVRSISQELLRIFSHFHDRLYIAQAFEMFDCCSNEHEKHSMLLGNRICKEILYCTLFGIIGCEYNEDLIQINSFCGLKKMILMTEKKFFSLYEHYVIIQILCILRNVIVAQKHWRKQKIEEIEAQNWILSDFNQCALLSQNLDVNKVKSLCSQVKLLWN